jgi:hypothetical protein
MKGWKLLSALCITGVMLAAVTIVIRTCRPEPNVWHRLAELELPSGERIVVGQEHYDWFEGWKVCFFLIDNSGVCYFDVLETESLSWSDVELIQKSDAVEIWMEGRQCGLYKPSSREIAGPKWTRVVEERFRKPYSDNPFPIPEKPKK